MTKELIIQVLQLAMRGSSGGNSKSTVQLKGGGSLSNLSEGRRTPDGGQLLRNNFVAERIKRDSFRDSKSRGRLRLGQTAKPIIILSKQQRLNPWSKRITISEQLITKKGLFALVSMGFLPKKTNCLQLLNNKYQFIESKQQSNKQTFMTNPAILMKTYYEVSKQQEVQEEQQHKEVKEEKKEDRSNKIRLSNKKKIVQKNQGNKIELVQQKMKLTFLNFHVQRNDSYIEYSKRLRRVGMQSTFSIFIAKVQQFTVRFNLKKITMVPQFNETKKISDRDILNCIVNHKIYGIDLKMKGSPIFILSNLVRMKVQKMKYKKKQLAVQRLSKIKNKFKIKKLYREMIDKRWKFINFKLGSFAENQRRFISDNLQSILKPQVQIHLLASNLSPSQITTYYKWNERKKIQLTRLYNNQADHIILLVNSHQSIQRWLQDIQSMPSNWKKPKIHIFYSSLDKYEVEQNGDIYFGLTSAIIAEIKQICAGKSAVAVPYRISNYLPKLCQILGMDLMAGSFTEQSKNMIFQDDEQTQNATLAVPAGQKFKKISHRSLQLSLYYSNKFKSIKLANQLLQSKQYVKQMFLALGLSTPVSVSLHNMNQYQFYQQFTKTILTHKSINRWVLKLPNSTMSRGLAFLETDSLKIIKETKKKAVLKQQDIDQISKLMESILVQKIFIPHNSLISGDQFVSMFKQTEGYVESVLQNSCTVCIFGRIELNGLFTMLGTYRKYYAENICFGAVYPAPEVNQSLLSKIKQLCSHLYRLNTFGYLTFELLLDDRNNQFYFMDIVPHLQSYSSLYFYYKRLLDMNQIDGGQINNQLKRYIFYCPFIDNNGNKCESISDFQLLLAQKKIGFHKDNIEGIKFMYLNDDVPDVMSLICVGKDQSSVIKLCLQGLNFLVEIGGQFNKFDKKYKNRQTDGLYIMDIIWKLRQMKKEIIEK